MGCAWRGVGGVRGYTGAVEPVANLDELRGAYDAFAWAMLLGMDANATVGAAIARAGNALGIEGRIGGIGRKERTTVKMDDFLLTGICVGGALFWLLLALEAIIEGH